MFEKVKNGRAWQSRFIPLRSKEHLPDGMSEMLPDLKSHGTFEREDCKPGILGAGLIIYRYHTDEKELENMLDEDGKAKEWFFATEDQYATVSEAVQKCALLDVSLTAVSRNAGGYSYDPTHVTTKEWNRAGVRGHYSVEKNIPVWFGRSRGIKIPWLNYHKDKTTKKDNVVYHGNPLVPSESYLSRAGGGNQILIHRSAFRLVKLMFVVKLPNT